MANVQNVTLGPTVSNLLKIASAAEDAAIKAENTAAVAENYASDLESKIPKTIRLAQPAKDAAIAADARTAIDEGLLANALADYERARVDALNARQQADDAYFRYIQSQEGAPAPPELISEAKIQEGLNTGAALGFITLGVSVAVAIANAEKQIAENKQKTKEYNWALSDYNNRVKAAKDAAEAFNVRAQTFEADAHTKFKETQRLTKIVAQDKATAAIAWATYEARKLDEQRDRDSIAAAIAAAAAARAAANVARAAANVARAAAIEARNSAITAAAAALIYKNNQGVSKFVDTIYDTRTATFVNNEPRILLISEYYDTEKDSLGALLVWQKYTNATHYEVFKRNIFIEDSKFERILFLDVDSLNEETENYINYFNQFININFTSDQVCIIFDPLVKLDRIYEYKIKASFVPNFISDVDFNSIVLSKKLDVLVGAPNELPAAATVTSNGDAAYLRALTVLEVDRRTQASTRARNLAANLIANSTGNFLNIRVSPMQARADAARAAAVRRAQQIVDANKLQTEPQPRITLVSQVFDIAGLLFNEPKLAWIISLLNDKVPFFGPDSKRSIASLVSPEKNIMAIKDPDVILKIIKDSFYLFGEKKTLMHTLNVLGGLNDDFKASFEESINESNDIFSYDVFTESIRKKIPALNYVLNAFSPTSSITADEATKIKRLAISAPPSRPGASENYTTLGGLSNIFNFANGMLTTTLDIQTKDNLNAIAVIYNGL